LVGAGVAFLDVAAIGIAVGLGPLGLIVGPALFFGIGYLGGFINNAVNQLIFRDASSFSLGRAENSALSGGISNTLGTIVGFGLGKTGAISAPGQADILGGLGGATSTIFGICGDTGIPAKDPNGGQGCF
jgi:hypothetical protein